MTAPPDAPATASSDASFEPPVDASHAPRAPGASVSQVAGADSPNLDVLRALAVLFVLFDTSYRSLRARWIGPLDLDVLGKLGLYFFFVHTALVLMRSLHRQWARTGGRRLASGFYLRRVFRIYPLSVAALALVAALRAPVQRVGPGGQFGAAAGTPAEWWSSLLLVQDLTHQPEILTMLWTVAVELRMYLVLPALYLLWRRVPWPWWPIGLWALAAVWSEARLPGVGFSLVPYAACFVPGVLAFTLEQRVAPRVAGVWWVPALAALVAMHLVLPRGRVTAWIVCLFLGLTIPFVREVRAPWLRTGAGAVARYGYAVFLLQAVVIWLVPAHLAGWPMSVRVAAYLAALGVLAVAAHSVVEAPGVRLGNRLAERWTGRTGASA